MLSLGTHSFPNVPAFNIERDKTYFKAVKIFYIKAGPFHEPFRLIALNNFHLVRKRKL